MPYIFARFYFCNPFQKADLDQRDGMISHEQNEFLVYANHCNAVCANIQKGFAMVNST